ncbi:hypothetical protein P168DRAFT_279385 [Aspergillus campestris IBT 28561]|uniref:Uncharacterized protein n=1 Tax=Aspergillus campestris (strain IBT 28561) TaxID=1392248 RepID=A0A2I1DC00_ASPC2|nr:uncharacterized protein P168DRAFT_279385 [Aspergillus campestris IBT 28561]PKY07412.1 hypothetical protein P168DRAFT_279385 [Aspergillus campestris IBT 28561]
MPHCKFLNTDVALSSDDQAPRTYSRRSCIDAALSILEIRTIFDDETGPDGQLYTMRWRASSFLKHEFLTATMLLSFLARQRQKGPIPLPEGYSLDRIMDALRQAHGIWVKSKNSPLEAKTVAAALQIVLGQQLDYPYRDIRRPDTNNDINLGLAMMMDPNFAWQWQTWFETELPQDSV